jgi:hypothetical protein
MLDAIQQVSLLFNSGLVLLKYLQHSDVIPADERQVMEDSLDAMIRALATATVQLEDYRYIHLERTILKSRITFRAIP